MFDTLPGGMAQSSNCQLQRRDWLSCSSHVVKKNWMFM